MKKSILLVLALISASILFWGCDDDKNTVSTEYVSVNISDIVDTVSIEVHNFIKKDTISDTTASDTVFKTSLSDLEYGSVLYTTGTFQLYLKTISVDQQHIRNAVIIRDMTVMDTLDEDTVSDTIFNNIDTSFYDETIKIDSTINLLPDSLFPHDTIFSFDIVDGDTKDTIITSNKSYLMSINEFGLGYIGLGYLMYSNANDVSISGLKALDDTHLIKSSNSNLFVSSSNAILKISSSIVNDTLFDTDTIDVTNAQISSIIPVDSALLAIDSKNGNVYVADASNDTFSLINTFAIGTGTINSATSYNNSLIISVSGTGLSDTIKKIDTLRATSVIENSKKGKGQIVSTIQDSLLVILTPRQDTTLRGALELVDISGISDTSIGVTTSARYVPAGISDMNFISASEGYVLDSVNNSLYLINISPTALGTEDDFLSEIASDVSSYTFDAKNLFISTLDGKVLVYNHSNLQNPIKEITITGGASSSLAILNK